MRPFALLASLGAVQVHSVSLNFKVLVRFPNNRSVPIYINETTGAYLPETDIVYDNPNYLEDYIVLNTPPPAAAPAGAAAGAGAGAAAGAGAGAAGAAAAGGDSGADADALSDGNDGNAAVDGSYGNQGAEILDGGAAGAIGSGAAGAASTDAASAGAAGGAESAGGGAGGGSAGSGGAGGGGGVSAEAVTVTPREVEDYIQDANNYLEHYNGYPTPKGVSALMSTKARLREVAIKAALPKMLHVEKGLSVQELERRMETKATPQTKLGRVLYSSSAPEWYNNFIVNSLEVSRAAPVARHGEAKEEVEQQKAVEVDNAGKILPKEGKQAKAEHLKEP